MQNAIISKLQLLVWAEEGTFFKHVKKTHTNLLSYTPNSIPTINSPTRPVAQIRWELVDITKFILHDDNSFTILTPEGNVRFWPKGTKGLKQYEKHI